jgi:hypothetical protein
MQTVGHKPTAGFLTQAGGPRVVSIGYEETIRWNACHQLSEGVFHRLQVWEDIGVIELNASEHTYVRLVVEKFGSFVEKSGVILIPLHHEVRTTPKEIALLEIGHQSTYQATRIHSSHGE